MRDAMKELLRKEAEERRQEEKELEENPLLQYSTSQLKTELRRRKKKECEIWLKQYCLWICQNRVICAIS